MYTATCWVVLLGPRALKRSSQCGCTGCCTLRCGSCRSGPTACGDCRIWLRCSSLQPTPPHPTSQDGCHMLLHQLPSTQQCSTTNARHSHAPARVAVPPLGVKQAAGPALICPDVLQGGQWYQPLLTDRWTAMGLLPQLAQMACACMTHRRSARCSPAPGGHDTARSCSSQLDHLT